MITIVFVIIYDDIFIFGCPKDCALNIPILELPSFKAILTIRVDPSVIES